MKGEIIMNEIDDGDVLLGLATVLIGLPLYIIYKLVTRDKEEQPAQNHQETSAAEGRDTSDRSNKIPHASRYANV